MKIDVPKQHLLLALPLAVLLLAVLLLVGAVPTLAAPPPPSSSSPAGSNPYAGTAMCVRCHEERLTDFETSPHGGDVFEEAFEKGCETCHGPSRAHIPEPGDPDHSPRFGQRSTTEQSQVCQECHGESNHGSGHAAKDVSCSDCHSIHDWQSGVSGTAGQERCSTCHVASDQRFADSAHSSVGVPCSDCHTLEGKDLPASGAAGIPFCLSCHGKTHASFRTSPHAAIGCSDCHSVHDMPPELETSSIFESATITGSSALCAECHEDVAAVFQLNERHRLQEGILDCTSCHDPHARSQRLRLGGFQQQECLACHADKGGPWVFEHPAQRVEGCVACHDPHGAVNRHLLKFQRVSDLCYSCHVAVPGFHVRFDPNRNCTDCHFAIHGSNFNHALLR